MVPNTPEHPLAEASVPLSTVHGIVQQSGGPRPSPAHLRYIFGINFERPTTAFPTSMTIEAPRVGERSGRSSSAEVGDETPS